MALTDAISVACKALGVGANIYWDSDRTKYEEAKTSTVKEVKSEINEAQIKRLYAIASENNIDNAKVKEYILKKYNKTSTSDLTKAQYEEVCKKMENKKQEESK